MVRQTPFSYNFSSPIGANEFKIGIRRFGKLTSLSVFIEDDNAGPILINAYILVEGQKQQIANPTGIYDGEGPNAKRFNWQGTKPLSLILENVLTIEHVNYSSGAIDKVRVSGVLDR